MTYKKENKSFGDDRLTIIDTLGPLMPRILKEVEKNTKDIQDIITALRRIQN
ncbi:hypothetical protein BH23THE1_BH23THE1_20510 [soil metagenome]